MVQTILKGINFTNNFTLRFLALACIGFANALPIPLMGTTLSIWLAEAGLTKEIIGLFSLLHIPFSLKILWTPVIDLVPLPFFIGQQRKGWILVALFGMALLLLGISYIDPHQHVYWLGAGILGLSFFSGCLYITGLAYELESLEEDSYGVGSAYVITGYRLGLLCAGGGALYISHLWDWIWMYRAMAACLCLAILVIMLQPEPYKSKKILEDKCVKFSGYRSVFSGFWNEIILQPCCSFFRKPEWRNIVLLLFLFKLGDQMAKCMEGPFYLSLGFNKVELATASKIWGMIATILGTFMTGFFLKNKDPFYSIGYIGIIHACTLPCYWILSIIGKSLWILYVTVALEHFTSGMAMTVFIYFLWKVCDKQHAAVQYALLWSFFGFKADIFSFLGGMLAAKCAWDIFFLTVALLGITSSMAVWGLLRRDVDKAVTNI